MYHSPNLPHPFSACLGGGNVNQRPTPSPSCGGHGPHREAPFCKEQRTCQETSFREAKPTCGEKPIYKERVSPPQPTRGGCVKKEKQWQVKEMPSCEPNTCSCNNGNLVPLFILALYLFKLI
ncbi:hypothetical protein [Anaerotignum sp. MB30-C6]|uniref:hypothetical protein n=1 Tax=Anaerotignum sp. MB30-C6 TaxID=3070814 RepID=UPI0027DE99B5|nr:hypothetical protein [Anaerotignum sp. MB30-C6]WMI81289.1 hypothetical protein RBQ60_00730 [Anaerotignum sp. MB30-C6]